MSIRAMEGGIDKGKDALMSIRAMEGGIDKGKDALMSIRAMEGGVGPVSLVCGTLPWCAAEVVGRQ